MSDPRREAPIPSTRSVVGRLALVGVGTVAAAWGVSFAVCLVGLALTADERLAALALGGCLAGVHAVAMSAAMAYALREAPGLRRALVRVRDGGDSVPPPSAVALRDLFAAPRRVMLGTALPMAALLVAEGLGVYSITGMTMPRRWAVVLTYLGVFQTWLVIGGEIGRSILWEWLQHVSVRDVVLEGAPSVARRLQGQHLSALTLISFGVLAVLCAHFGVDGPLSGAGREALVWAAGLASLAIVSVVAMSSVQASRLGALTAADIRQLSENVRTATQASSWETGDLARAGAEGFQTGEVKGLAERIEGLLRRYAGLASDEHHARMATEDAQRLKSRFMAYMSHDLRSPLNSITGFAEVLANETDGPLNDDQRESVETIRESGQELLRLVTAIVDSARLEAGRLQMHPAWVPSATVVSGAVGAVRAIAGRAPIEVVAELQPGMPPVYVDGERVQQALVGVLVHVVRMVKDGTVRLAAHVESGPPGPVGQVRVTIDASPPIPEEDRARIFEAFREIREPSGRRVGGLGLGVSLARGLMVEQGGDLWYEASGDVGVRFCMALPTEGPAPAPPTGGDSGFK